MKKLACLLAAIMMLFSVSLAEVDLSGMSYAELVALKDKINLAMWNSQEWQEVTVPEGIWQIGVDIPVGHWQITATPKGSYISVDYGKTVNESGRIAVSFNSVWISKTLHGTEKYGYNPDNDTNSFDIDCKEGMYIVISGGNVIFTPYAGKPSLGFK